MQTEGLGKRSVSASLWYIMSTGGQLVLQFAFFVVLARLLGPRPFGLISIAAIFLDLVTLVARFGIVEALVQRTAVHHRTYSTAFWLTCFFGLVSSLVIVGSSSAIARMYELEEMRGILFALAPLCFFNAICAVYEAQLRIELRFKSLAIRNLAAAIIGYLVAIAFAFAGYGVWSLVIQRMTVTAVMLAVLVQQTRWRPTLDVDVGEGRELSQAGFYIVCISLLGNWNLKVIDLIIGLVLGPVPLGYLRIAWRGPEILQQVSIQALIPVAMSSFARLKDDRDRFRAAYARVVHGTSLLMYPLYAGLIIFAPVFIGVFFGHRWDNSIVPMQIIAITGFIAPLFYYNGIAMLSMGFNRLVLVINAFEFLLSCICALIMARRGLEWAAASHVVRTIIFVPFSLWFAKRELGLPFVGSLRACWWPAVSTLVFAGVAAAVASGVSAQLDALPTAILAGSAGLASYLLAAWLLDRTSVLFLLEKSPVGFLARFAAVAQRRRAERTV